MRQVFAALVLAASPGVAQDGARVDITLSNFRYSPPTISLRHGERYVFHLTNTSGGGHDFAAPAFFAAAQIDPADRPLVDKGRVEVDGGTSRDLRLTAPAAGTYPVHCSHFLHATFGMKGSIVVD